MKKSAMVMLAVAVVVTVVGALVYNGRLGSSMKVPAGAASSSGSSQSSSATTAQLQTAKTTLPETADAALSERLRALVNGAGGDVGVAVIHVETGRTAEFDSAKPLPLYSVFKLPVAITVLRNVEEKKLSLDQKVRVTPGDVASGSQANADLWRKPVEKSVTELLEVSIVRSDNTSTDKLLQLVGGPSAVTERMRALGFANFDIKYTTREFAANRDRPNTGTAAGLAQLLAKLQQGELVQPAHLAMLREFMARSMTGGERRLRADLPAGTPVADKTGTGGPGTSTNDVGLITLPAGKGHLAIAVLVSGSKLSTEAQEKLIAQLARAAYDHFVAAPPPPTT
jgi:beta-lactamase class A